MMLTYGHYADIHHGTDDFLVWEEDRPLEMFWFARIRQMKLEVMVSHVWTVSKGQGSIYINVHLLTKKMTLMYTC